jgi:hypothetical protein
MSDLFGDPRHSVTDQVLRAYEHQDKWVNRLVLGDSLVVMNSLLRYGAPRNLPKRHAPSNLQPRLLTTPPRGGDRRSSSKTSNQGHPRSFEDEGVKPRQVFFGPSYLHGDA